MLFLACFVQYASLALHLVHGSSVEANLSREAQIWPLENNRMTMDLGYFVAGDVNKSPILVTKKSCKHIACNQNDVEDPLHFPPQMNQSPAVSQIFLQDESQLHKKKHNLGLTALFRSQRSHKPTRKLLQTSGYFSSEVWMAGHDRKQIGSAHYPFSAIGQLDNGCTGTLIGPCHVLTAAHCIYDPKTRKWSDKLGFTPGRTGGGAWEPHGRAEARSKNVMLGWQLFSDFASDLGLVVLDRRVGDVVGTMSFGNNRQGEVIPLNMAGYPNDKGAGEMWYDYCEGAKRDYSANNVVYHGCTPHNGNSGSPLWVYDQSHSFREIRGVHTGVVSHVSVMLSANGQNNNKEQPFGVMITEHESSILNRWMRENQC